MLLKADLFWCIFSWCLQGSSSLNSFSTKDDQKTTHSVTWSAKDDTLSHVISKRGETQSRVWQGATRRVRERVCVSACEATERESKRERARACREKVWFARLHLFIVCTVSVYHRTPHLRARPPEKHNARAQRYRATSSRSRDGTQARHTKSFHFTSPLTQSHNPISQLHTDWLCVPYLLLTVEILG